MALITGGTSGIGARTAELFATEGASVVVAGRRHREGEALSARLGARVSFVAADVSVEVEVEAMVAHAVDRHGRLDCLVNNAGDGGAAMPITKTDVARFQRTMAVHLGGAVSGTKHAGAIMLSQGSGSIVNIASVGGSVAGWSPIDYSTAKAAVIHFTRCAAVELGEHGVRVNSISPGPILTGIFAKGAGWDPGEADRAADLLEPVFRRALASWQPIRRAGVTDDVAAAALWFASDHSAFVTGQNVAVDGGISAGRPASVSASAFAELAQALMRKD